MIIKDNKLVLITKLTIIQFDLPKDFGNNLKHEIDFVIKPNEFLAEHSIKVNYCVEKISVQKRFSGKQNSKAKEPHRFVLNLLQILDIKSSNKHVALQNLSIYYTWKIIRQQYKNSKLKTLALTWNDNFELP